MKLDSICRFCWKQGRNRNCNGKECCLYKLYEEKKNITTEDIIKWCCVERCHHDRLYHEKDCPISKAGINKKYPLNPKLEKKICHIQ